jgi:hypothetical protein
MFIAADVRFDAHYRLKSDSEPCPKSGHEQTWSTNKSHAAKAKAARRRLSRFEIM